MSKLLVLYPTVPGSAMMTTMAMYHSSTKRLLAIESQATVTEEVGIDQKCIALSPDVPSSVDFTWLTWNMFFN